MRPYERKTPMSDFELNPSELAIYQILKDSPEPTLYVSPDGNHIYIIAGEGETEGLMHITRVEGKPYNEMDGDELNEVIIDFMTNATWQ